MSTGAATSPLSRGWKELYKDALFKTDESRRSARIAHAEWALALRARELFHADRLHLQERYRMQQYIDLLPCFRIKLSMICALLYTYEGKLVTSKPQLETNLALFNEK